MGNVCPKILNSDEQHENTRIKSKENRASYDNLSGLEVESQLFDNDPLMPKKFQSEERKVLKTKIKQREYLVKCIKDNFLISGLSKVRSKIKNVNIDEHMSVKLDKVQKIDLRMKLLSKNKKYGQIIKNVTEFKETNALNECRASTGSRYSHNSSISNISNISNVSGISGVTSQASFLTVDNNDQRQVTEVYKYGFYCQTIVNFSAKDLVYHRIFDNSSLLGKEQKIDIFEQLYPFLKDASIKAYFEIENMKFFLCRLTTISKGVLIPMELTYIRVFKKLTTGEYLEMYVRLNSNEEQEYKQIDHFEACILYEPLTKDQTQQENNNDIYQGDIQGLNNNQYTKVTIIGDVSLDEYKEPSFNNLIGFNFAEYLLTLNKVLADQLKIWSSSDVAENGEIFNTDKKIDDSQTDIDQWDYMLGKIEDEIYDKGLVEQ